MSSMFTNYTTHESRKDILKKMFKGFKNSTSNVSDFSDVFLAHYRYGLNDNSMGFSNKRRMQCMERFSRAVGAPL